MPLFDVTPLVATRMCPKCEEDRFHTQLVTDETMYFRCMTCGCVWHQPDHGMHRPMGEAKVVVCTECGGTPIVFRTRETDYFWCEQCGHGWHQPYTPEPPSPDAPHRRKSDRAKG